MRKRCLIIGASGQLGRALGEEFSPHHDLIKTFYHPPGPKDLRCDLSDSASLRALLEEQAPDWILIAGAFCNVDLCETESAACFKVNVEGPRAVAEYAREAGARAVYFSTDHVFDGTEASNNETDIVHPLNVYATSKVRGEEALAQLFEDRHLILRTAWLYGPDAARRNFILRLIDRLKAGQPIRVPQDQWGSPTLTLDLARATRFLLEGERTGIYHATGPDFLDRVALAQAVCRHFSLDPAAIHPVSTQALQQAARRPLRVRLDCKKLICEGVPVFHPLAEGLRALNKNSPSTSSV